MCVILFCKQKQDCSSSSSRPRVNTLKKDDSEILITQKLWTIENMVVCNQAYLIAIRVVEFSNRGYKIRKIFWLLKNQHTQRKVLNFEFWINGELSKIGHHKSDSNKNFKNWFYQQMLITKNVLLNWYSLMKKMRKIRRIFDIENWHRKSNFGTFWQLPVNPKLKIQ